jgi:hypothetical protein
MAECDSAILVAIRKSKSLLGAGMCSSRLIILKVKKVKNKKQKKKGKKKGKKKNKARKK